MNPFIVSSPIFSLCVTVGDITLFLVIAWGFKAMQLHQTGRVSVSLRKFSPWLFALSILLFLAMGVWSIWTQRSDGFVRPALALASPDYWLLAILSTLGEACGIAAIFLEVLPQADDGSEG